MDTITAVANAKEIGGTESTPEHQAVFDALGGLRARG
jgi:hypothetical protein